MTNNANLSNARKKKNDEFYTQYCDIEAEMNTYLEYNPYVFKDKTVLLPCDDPEWSNFTKWFAQNFEKIGLKKLISTSYANEKKMAIMHQISLFELDDPKYDVTKSNSNGKIFVLERGNHKVDINDLKWNYLEGDGDFRSKEVVKLRDEADIIITNCPFSLFREFMAWILEANKSFSVIGNQNAITYKEIFPYIMKNKMWLGASIHSGDRKFYVPNDYPLKAAKCGIDKDGKRYVNVKGVRWFTNIENGRRHQPLSLMTMNDNIRYSKHKQIKGHEYVKYCNYDAIEVPFSDAIPSDYKGAMGVPITFLDKFCPDQFEIIGSADANVLPDGWRGMTKEFVKLYYEQGNTGSYKEGNRLACFIDSDGNAKVPYKRILVRFRK